MPLPREAVSALFSEAMCIIEKAGDFESRRPFGF
jgi:hypothetical protein